MLKRFLILVFVIACWHVLSAQRSVQDQVFADAFRGELSSMVEVFNHELPCHMYAYWYAYADNDGDGTGEFLLSDFKRSYINAYKFRDGDVRQVPANLKADDCDWRPLKWLFSDQTLQGDPMADVTLRYRPVFADNVDIQANRFKVSTEVCNYLDLNNKVSDYDRMIFKPHVNPVQFVSAKSSPKGSVYTFSLPNAAMTKKMFRGYASTQTSPILVPKEFLESHTPLQYSRWLQGEKEVKASPDAKQIISDFFGGRKVYDSRWLASCEVNERLFYYVVFAPEPDESYVLVSLVCMAEGEVVSVCNEWLALDDDSRTTVVSGETLSDLLFHAPQIMAMVAADSGLELYVRWPSNDGLHYSILREYMNEFIYIQDDFENMVAE